MKNAVIDVIRSRRSVRRYRPDPVPPEALEAVLEAALWAPSACDGQPWHFKIGRASCRERVWIPV